MPDATTIIFLCVLAANFALATWLERSQPERAQNGDDRRLIINFGLGVIGMMTTMLPWVTPVAMALLVERTGASPLALHRLALPVETGLALLSFSVASYFLHRAMHANALLWRVHRLHHSDSSVDFSTGFRTHPVEYLMTAALLSAIVYVAGYGGTAVLLALTFLYALHLVTHINTRLPERIERWLGVVVVTPTIHLRHHSVLRAEHDSNFGNELIIWDRLFGTFGAGDPPQELGLKPTSARAISSQMESFDG